MDEKAAIVAESFEPGVSVSAVARRHGLSPSQLFMWRRLARHVGSDDDAGELRFIRKRRPQATALRGFGA